MKSPGFTLIELLIAMAISAMIAMILFSGLSQTTSTMKRVDDVIDVNSQAIVASHQLERDITGAFVPVEGLRKKSTSATASAGEPKKEAVEKETKQKEDKTKPKKISKIFFGSVKDGNLDTLTFITNNPVTDPICVNRIVYRLVPDKVKKNEEPSYSLMRQEGTDLTLDAFNTGLEKPIRSYQLMGHIQKLTVIYTAALVKEKVERKGNQEIKTIETEYKVYNDWDVEEEIKKATQPDQLRRKIIPYAVDINFSLWNANKKRSFPYSIKIVIVPDIDEFEPEERKAAAPTPPPQQQQPPVPQAQQKQQQAQQQQKKGAGIFAHLNKQKKPQTAFDKIPSVISTLLGAKTNPPQQQAQQQMPPGVTS